MIAYCLTQCFNGCSLDSLLFLRQDNHVQRCKSYFSYSTIKISEKSPRGWSRTANLWAKDLRQQTVLIRNYSRLPDAFVERASHVCKIHERRVTDVYAFCITMFEKREILFEDHFNMKQWTKFRDGFLNRWCHFEIEIWGSIDAVFLMRKCFAKASEFRKSIALFVWIIQFLNPFFRFNRAYDFCNLMTETCALQLCIDYTILKWHSQFKTR